MPSPRRTLPRLAPLTGVTLLAVATAGCGAILGLDAFSEQASTTTGSGGSGTTASTSDASASAGTGGAAAACTAADAATVCDDKNACTDDTCAPAGTCLNTPQKLGTACGDAAAYTCDDKGVCLDGHTLWAQRYGDGGGEQAGEAIAADKDGNILVTGYFKGNVDFDGNPLSSLTHDAAFLARLDGAGKAIWSKLLMGASNSFGNAVAADGSGNVIFGGTVDAMSLIKLDPKGNTLWQAPFVLKDALSSYGVTAVAVGKADGLVVTGRFGGSVDFGKGFVTSKNNDVFLAKLMPDGQLAWVETFSSDMQSFASTSVAVDANANILLGGVLAGTVKLDGVNPTTSAGGKDAFVIKLDPTGKNLWTDVFGDGADQLIEGVAFDPSNQIIVTGSFGGSVNLGLGGMKTSAGKNDGFVLKLSSTEGKVLWANTFGDSADQQAHAVAVDSAGNVLVTGEFLGTVDFGGGPIVGMPPANTFVTKYNGVGKHLWTRAYADALANAIGVDPSGSPLLTGTFVGSTDFGLGVLNTVGDLNIFVVKLAP